MPNEINCCEVWPPEPCAPFVPASNQDLVPETCSFNINQDYLPLSN